MKKKQLDLYSLMVDILENFANKENLEHQSACEMIFLENLTDYQENFLKRYSNIWNRMLDHIDFNDQYKDISERIEKLY